MQVETQPSVATPEPLATMAAQSAPAPLLSLIVPAYNEGQRLAPSLAAMSAFFRARGFPYEILVVDDGSTDETAAIIAAAAAADPALRAAGYATNRGKGHAVRVGMLAARGDYLMFTDADLSIPLAITDDFLDALRGDYDIAIASRWHPASKNAVPPPFAPPGDGRDLPLVRAAPGDQRCARHAMRLQGLSRRCRARSLLGQPDRPVQLRRGGDLPGGAGRVIGSRKCRSSSTIPPVAASAPCATRCLMVRDLARIRLNAARGVYGRAGAGDLARRAG